MGILSQTVTVYRADGSRRILRNCQLEYKNEQHTDCNGTRRRDQFMLIVPGECDLKPGDRLLAGVGPETVDWEVFLPEMGEGVCSVSYVQPRYWNGRVHHIEAGGSYDRY